MRKRFNRYEFDVGVLQDKPHYQAIDATPPDLKTYAGGPARKISKVLSGKTIGDVFTENMQRLGIDLLREPFDKKSSDIIKFSKAFMAMAISNGKIGRKRVENLLQAIVRNPILRGDYGPNNGATADAKGFDRHMIDTSQMFRAIRAKITKG
jgi:hypothetical protein